MSYEKVKCITRKPKEGKIFITSACSNVRPLTYHKWEFMQNCNDYHEKELELMRGINGGGLSLNDSCYNWNYAYYKTNEEIRARYSEYDLYELSTMHYTRYCLGEQISSTYTPITQAEIESGNYEYVLEWESKDGKSKVYYRAEEYNKEKIRTREVLERYHEVFMQFLEEKHEGKYYLYSNTYGYVKPKGTSGSFYYSEYNSFIETMDYKKAYCLKKAIGRDVEVKAVPTREYEPIQKQKEESKTRIELLGLEPRFSEKLYISDRYMIREVQEKETELIKAINEFEKEYNAYVYHIVYSNTNIGQLYTMLYVSSHEEEWESDRADIKEKQLYAYVWNRTDNCCSEIGLVGIEKVEHTNLLQRTF